MGHDKQRTRGQLGIVTASSIAIALGLAPGALANESQNGAPMVILNPGGGTAADGSDGLQVVLNGNTDWDGTANASDSVPEDGSDQVYAFDMSHWCCGGVGPMLNIGGQLVGEAGAASNESAPSWDSVTLVSSSGSAVSVPAAQNPQPALPADLPSAPTGTGSALFRYTTIQGGLTYTMERTATYTAGDPFWTDEYVFTIPAGNAAPVKFYLGGDAAVGNSDGNAFGLMVTQPRRVIYEVSNPTGIQLGFSETSGGGAFDHWFAGHYSDPYNDIDAGNNLDDSIDGTTHDDGIDIQWTLGSTPGTYTRSLRRIVTKAEPNVSASFAASEITAGASTDLSFVLVNTNAAQETGLGFTAALPSGMTVAGTGSTTCSGALTASAGDGSITLNSTTLAGAASCIVTVPVTAGQPGTYTLPFADITTTGTLKAQAGSAVLAVTGDPVPLPTPQPGPAPTAAPTTAPLQQVPVVVTPLAAPTTAVATGPGVSGLTRVVSRLQFDRAGRYTFIYEDSRTGKRIPMRRSSAIGYRELRRTYSAPVLRNTRPGRRLVIRAYLDPRRAKAAGNALRLRIILRESSGTLSEVSLGPDGRLSR